LQVYGDQSFWLDHKLAAKKLDQCFPISKHTQVIYAYIRKICHLMTAHSNNAKGNILFLRKEAQYCVCEKVVFMRLVEKPPHGAVENASLNG